MNKVLAALILIAILPMPHDYYWILRSLVFVGSVYFFFHDKERLNELAKWGLFISAMVYNPFLPLYLGKPIWIIINIVSGAFFAYLDKLKVKIQS